jgi:hypothetical protein
VIVRWYNLPAWSISSFPFSGLRISVYHVVALLLPCYAAGPGCHMCHIETAFSGATKQAKKRKAAAEGEGKAHKRRC